ncbi:hypothetical protein [Granulosicoccus antarcticus]|uniref:Uncharacterized protein n=1 Tax=Granulosicoccus antarcticus IMCC3135 TaxID=1192854 RepID=A0A2Z2P109_9GAMM|nr:hypothetical protein [Granulosicoccus antarcticus]ASJ73234.1 hypothetical protein IMCC3135_15760 [Granulosicoccus antarcticus IMCC3135]
MIESQRPEFARCLLAMLVWFFLSTSSGILVAFIGPGAAAIVAGLLLSVCGMTLHLLLWAIGRTPHWSYAGLVFGSVTTILLLIASGSSSWQLVVVLILFVSFSILSGVIYPIANRVLGSSPKCGSSDESHER